MRPLRNGFSVAELTVSLAVLSMLVFLSVPPLLEASGDFRLRLAAQEAVVVMRGARSMAVRRSAYVAVRFRADANGRATWAVYVDGDGDGVLSRDIDSGRDRVLSPPRLLSPHDSGVMYGFPPGQVIPDPGSPRTRLHLEDPVRFNRSDMASFSALGESTPGSLYLTDGKRRLVAVRVFGRTGRVRVLTWNPKTRVWS
jgi:Type II transport protein GspH